MSNRLPPPADVWMDERLGDDTIHAVTNAVERFTGAIHVYAGDITQRPGRSEWDEDTLAEVDYDFERVRRYFDAENARQ